MGDKVIMLTHSYPHFRGEDEIAIFYHQADSPL